jgi:hypothetical protein
MAYNYDDYLNDSEDDEDDAGESPKCGCKYCFCSNDTIAGEACNDCLAGAHQG